MCGFFPFFKYGMHAWELKTQISLGMFMVCILKSVLTIGLILLPISVYGGGTSALVLNVDENRMDAGRKRHYESNLARLRESLELHVFRLPHLFPFLSIFSEITQCPMHITSKVLILIYKSVDIYH